MAARGEGSEVIPAVLLVLFLLACLIHAAVTCRDAPDGANAGPAIPAHFH